MIFEIIKKTRYIIILFIVFSLTIFSFLSSKVVFAEDIEILKLLKSKNNEDFIGLTVQGDIFIDDIISVFINDEPVAIKLQKVEETLKSDESLNVINIPVAFLETGENNFIAKIERDGEEVAVSEKFKVNVNLPLEPLKVISAIENNNIVLTINGDLKIGDVLMVYQNDSEIKKINIVEKLYKEDFKINISSTDMLEAGDYVFFVEQKRENFNNVKSLKTNKITIEEIVIDNFCPVFEKIQEVENNLTENNFGIDFDISEKYLAVLDDSDLYIYKKQNENFDFLNSFVDVREKEDFFDNLVSIQGDSVYVSNKNLNTFGYNSGGFNLFKEKDNIFSFVEFRENIPNIRKNDEVKKLGDAIDVNENILALSYEGKLEKGGMFIFENSQKGGNSEESEFPFIPRENITIPDLPYKAEFGYSVSVDGHNFAVGSPGDRSINGFNGSVYVFEKKGDEYGFTKISTNNTLKNQRFGEKVLLKTNLLFVSANSSEDNKAHSVYIFKKNNSVWEEFQILKLSSKDLDSDFGKSFAYSEPFLFVGAYKDFHITDRSVNSGSVYVFSTSKEDDLFKLKNVLRNPNNKNEKYGYDVKIKNDILAVSTPSASTGKILLYSVTEGECLEEVNIKLQEEDNINLINESDLVNNLDQLRLKIQDLLTLLNIEKEQVEEIESLKREGVSYPQTNLVSVDAQIEAAERRGLRAPLVRPPVYVPPVVKPQLTEKTKEQIVETTEKDIFIGLKEGDVSDDVLKLQVFLNENGYTVNTSGPGSKGQETKSFDSNTTRALRVFQLVNGLDATGIYDAKTRDLIITLIN